MRLPLVRLIAAREIRVRVRSRAFQISTAISLAMVALLIVVPTLRSDRSVTYEVIAVDIDQTIAALGVEQAARATGVDATVEPSSDRAAAERRVRAGDADAAIIGSEVVVRRAPQPGDNSRGARFAGALSRSIANQQALASLGVDVRRATEALERPALPVRGTLPPKTGDRERATALAGIVLLFFQLVQYSNWVVTGVIEEKSSRIVEVLLCTVRPVELLTGKVVGIGAIALAHSLALLTTALGASVLTGSDVLTKTAWAAAIGAAGWFVLGYAFSCTVNAAAGSLVSRQEDAQAVVTPIMVPMMVGYIVSTTALASGDANLLLRVLSYVPLTAPFAMPALIAVGAVSAVDVAVSVAIMLAAIVGGARLASRVYARSILRTGRRIGWREALRAPTA